VLYLKQDTNNVIYSNLLSRGYKEAAEVIGGEEVTCGDFSCAVPTDYWTFNTGWSTDGTKAISDTSSGYVNINQTTSIVINKSYRISFTVSDYSSGNVQFIIGNAGSRPSGVLRSANGTYNEDITVDTSTVDADKFFIRGGASGFTGSISNISVKEVQTNAFSWLINITNDFTKESKTLLQIVDNSVNITPGTNTVSYPIKVITSGTANGLNQEVLLKNTGYYSYEIYKQDSLTNLDVNNAVVGKLVESGKALVYNDTKEVNYKEQADGNPNNFIYVP
jgi:hypothetical protein